MLVAGGVVVLAGLLVFALLPGSGPAKSGTPAANAASVSPSPSLTAVSPDEYQRALDTLDRDLGTVVQNASAADSPTATFSTMNLLQLDIEAEATTLSKLQPPGAAWPTNVELVAALRELSSDAALTASQAQSQDLCAGPSAMARFSRSSGAGSFRKAVMDLSTAAEN